MVGGVKHFYPPSDSDIPMHGWRPYSDIHRERIRAHKLHDDHGQSMERREYTDSRWLPVVVEEVGEVARVLCDGENTNRLRAELVQVAAMVIAWIEAIDLERDI
jgi:NTP pyrophosphatase (non-canonical NTP hydrolase)